MDNYTLKMEIMKEAKSRGIRYLVHFTPEENLQSILKYGLLSVRKLRNLGIRYEFNDPRRMDGVDDAICLSVSFPNYKLFWKFRKNNPNRTYVVLLIDAKVLWEKSCIFTWTNAANRQVSCLKRDEKMTPEAFKRMFGNLEKRRQMGLSPEYPTDYQAEVMVIEDIEPKYIKYVVVEKLEDLFSSCIYPLYLSSISQKASYKFIVDSTYFLWRKAEEIWRTVGIG